MRAESAEASRHPTRAGKKAQRLAFCSVALLTSLLLLCAPPCPIPTNPPVCLAPAAPSSASPTRSHSLRHSVLVARTSLSPPSGCPAASELDSRAGANRTALGG